jgi:hypothetical protein
MDFLKYRSFCDMSVSEAVRDESTVNAVMARVVTVRIKHSNVVRKLIFLMV